MGYGTRKFERERAERPWKVHPIWRGIGCLMLLLIPTMAWAGMKMVVDNDSLFKLPESLTQPVILKYTQYDWMNQAISWLNENLGGRGLSYDQLVFWLAFLLVGYLILVVLYGLLYRLVGPPKYGPLDSPPVPKGFRR